MENRHGQHHWHILWLRQNAFYSQHFEISATIITLS